MPFLKVYLEGSFFRKLEDSTGIKIDYLRTSKSLSVELSDFLKSNSIQNSGLIIEIERNFDEIYILGEGDLSTTSTKIINWWESWKITRILQLGILEKNLREGLRNE